MRKWFWLAVLGATLLVGLALWFRVRQVVRQTATLASAQVASATAVFPTSIEAAETAYDGRLGPGWHDWSVGLHELSSSGPAKVVFADHGGVVLHHSELRAIYGGLAFRFKAPSSWGP